MKRLPRSRIVTQIFRRALRAQQFRQSITCSSPNHKQDLLEDVPSSTHLAKLPHRCVVHVKGKDGPNLLQGLLTADVTGLGQRSSVFSMLLNAQGRVLYDVILYRLEEEDHMIECDSEIVNKVITHLKRYALRSDVTINSETSCDVWMAYPGKPAEPTRDTIISVLDPRLSSFGSRILAPTILSASEIAPSIPVSTPEHYHKHRLKLGIAEGQTEIPAGACFPLEYNLDYLNGVSFSKGCYLGQELTARTHHTGIIRKRVMPVAFDESSAGGEIGSGAKLVNSSGKAVGKLIGHLGGLGLALLRVKEVESGPLYFEDEQGVEVVVNTPSWWPS